MISRSLRQRIGSLLREETRVRPGSKLPRAGEGAGRRVLPAAIEDVLPGGVVIGKHGPLFVHERLYTELNERPAPLLKRYQEIAKQPGSRRRGRARTLREAIQALEPP